MRWTSLSVSSFNNAMRLAIVIHQPNFLIQPTKCGIKLNAPVPGNGIILVYPRSIKESLGFIAPEERQNS